MNVEPRIVQKYIRVWERETGSGTSPNERRVAQKIRASMEGRYPGVRQAAERSITAQRARANGDSPQGWSRDPRYRAAREGLKNAGVAVPGWSDTVADVLGNVIHQARTRLDVSILVAETAVLRARFLKNGSLTVRVDVEEDALDDGLLYCGEDYADLERYCDLVGQLVAEEMLFCLPSADDGA